MTAYDYNTKTKQKHFKTELLTVTSSSNIPAPHLLFLISPSNV